MVTNKDDNVPVCAIVADLSTEREEIGLDDHREVFVPDETALDL